MHPIADYLSQYAVNRPLGGSTQIRAAVADRVWADELGNSRRM
jgi:hypothetical protein